jgi:hypothetical protein
MLCFSAPFCFFARQYTPPVTDPREKLRKSDEKTEQAQPAAGQYGQNWNSMRLPDQNRPGATEKADSLKAVL